MLSRFPSDSVFLLGRGEIPPNIPANALLDFGVVGGSPALFPFSVLTKKKSKSMSGCGYVCNVCLIQLYRSIVINLQMYLSKVLVRPFSGTDMLSTSVTSFFKYFQHTYQCYKSLQKCWSYLDKHIIIAAMHRSEIPIHFNVLVPIHIQVAL